jgi:DNA ligase 1
MRFAEFSQTLCEIEGLPGRLDKTGVLVELFTKLAPEEIEEAVWLSMGALGPAYETIEFQVADKTIIKVVSDITALSIAEVEEKYKEVGDLGEIVMQIRCEGNILSVAEVYRDLRLLSEMSGLGSQEAKRLWLVEVFNKLSSVERKILIRILQGKLRTGFSDKTILETLVAISGRPRSDKKILDSVYQVFPNIGKISKIIREFGWEAGLGRLGMCVGVPVIPALCQRLNSASEIIAKMGEVAVERKYDGTRVQIHYSRSKKILRSFTRNLEESSSMFPELSRLGEWLTRDEVILDCEAVGYDVSTGKLLPFQTTITRKRKHDIQNVSESVPLRFFVFDVLFCDGQNLLKTGYAKRRELLNVLFEENDCFVVDEPLVTADAEELRSAHEQYLVDGFEGAVIKKIDGEYLPGRQGWNWVKIKEAEGTQGKLLDTLDLVILGYYTGKGKRSDFGIGAFLVGLMKDDGWVSISKIGTGLSDQEFYDMFDRLSKSKLRGNEYAVSIDKTIEPDVWVKPEVVVEVAADEITESKLHKGGLALRFPRMIRVREDKSTNEATSWSELLEIRL